MKHKNTETLHGLLILKLQALYDIEQEIVDALPKILEHTTNIDLQKIFTDHLAETEGHVKRLEQAFQLLNEEPETLKCESIRGLVSDTKWLIKKVKKPEVLDAALAAAAQYIEHLEIAGYGSAYEWAKRMKHIEVAELLKQTLEEEKGGDKKMNDLAISKLNDRANLPDPRMI